MLARLIFSHPIRFIFSSSFLLSYLAVRYPEKIAACCEGGQSHEATLCARFALSAANDESFLCPCTHGRDPAGNVGPAPETMHDLTQRLHGRDADWDEVCGNDLPSSFCAMTAPRLGRR